MKFKKSITLLFCFVLVLSLSVGCNKSKEASTGGASEVIKVGSILPLTGDNATFGQSSKNALEILVKDTNEKGGILGKDVQIIYEDDESKPTNAANVAQKLINNDKVVALLGSVTSKCSIAIGPIATQNKIPMIATTATNPKVTIDGGAYVYRACFIDPFQGTVLAKFSVEDLKVTKAAVLYDVANDYSKGLADFYKEGFEALDGEIVAFETYTTGDTDFNAQLTKIKEMAPEVIMLPDYYNTVGLITKQARAIGIDAIFIGGDGWDSPDLFNVGGDSVDQCYFSNHYSPDDTSEEVVTFKAKYFEAYGAVPDAMAALAYDSGKILFAAIEKAGSTEGAKVIEQLNGLEIKVVSGNIQFDENRNPIKEAVIIKTEGGKQVFFKKVTP